ncbi:hypothetical protein RclHR1_01620001 [Rhizophagus clarus]|uniref:Uncharacterized protein n=1 Tax=Rhizophagus clarus TaxID=94130 RepID=A0A2Z6QUI8_9GLOM|nr:hypothetical protein RclHR1_01620001 [Rhizophagus clarus]GES87237.1 hypothetical protein GLOIN_2v1525807 [Rhizophagus clarus]
MERNSIQSESSSSKKKLENNDYDENIFKNQVILKLEMDGFTTQDEKVKKLIEELTEVKNLYALKLLFEDFRNEISDPVLVKSLEDLANPALFKSYYSKESAARLELHIRTWVASLERILFKEIHLPREILNNLYNSLTKFAKIHRKTTQVMEEGLNNVKPKINQSVEERIEIAKKRNYNIDFLLIHLRDTLNSLRDDENWIREIFRRLMSFLKTFLNITPGALPGLPIPNDNCSILSMLSKLRQGLSFKHPVASYYVDWRIILLIRYEFTELSGSSKKFCEMMLIEYIWAYLEREWKNVTNNTILDSQLKFDEISNKLTKTLRNAGSFINDLAENEPLALPDTLWFGVLDLAQNLVQTSTQTSIYGLCYYLAIESLNKAPGSFIQFKAIEVLLYLYNVNKELFSVIEIDLEQYAKRLGVNNLSIERFENLLGYVREKCHIELKIINNNNNNNENKKGKGTILSANKRGEILNNIAEDITCPINNEPADKLCIFGCHHIISFDSFVKLKKDTCPICRQNIECINILPQNTIYKNLNSQFTKSGHIMPSIDLENLDHTSDSNDSEVDIMLSKKMNIVRKIRLNTNKLRSIFQIGNSMKQNPIYQNVIKELTERNYKQAVDWCQKYLKNYPKSYSMKCLMAYSYRRLNNYDQACSYLDEAIKLKEKDPIAWYIYGEIFFRQNMYDDVISKLEISRGLNANIDNLNVVLGCSYLFQIMKSNNKSNYIINEHALKIFNEIQNTPKKYLCLKYCAYLYEMQKDYLNTLSVLDSYLNINNEDSLILCYYGEILNKLGRYNEAIEYFKRAYDVDPENVHNLSRRAITYHMLGKYDEALLDLNKALQLNQSCSLAYHYRGLTFYSMKNINKSISDFEKCVQLDSSDMLARMQLLYLNHKLKKSGDIFSEINQIANIDDDESLLFIRCKIYIELKEYDKTLLDLNRLFELNYDDISFVHLLQEYFDFWIYVCDYYNISDDGFTDIGIAEKLNQYMYKVKAIYFVSNLDNISIINYNIQDDDDSDKNCILTDKSMSRKVLVIKNNLATFPRLSNIWQKDVKYYVAWRLCVKELSSNDCSLNFMIKIGNGDDSYDQIEYTLERDKLSKFIGLGWIEYTVPLKVEPDRLDWIEPSIKSNNGLIIKIDYVRFTSFEKDLIYLPKIDCLPIYKLHPGVPRAFEDKYFQKKVVENLFELSDIINYLK